MPRLQPESRQDFDDTGLSRSDDPDQLDYQPDQLPDQLDPYDLPEFPDLPDASVPPPLPLDFLSPPAASAPPPPVLRHPSAPLPDLIPKILMANTINLIAGASGVGKTAMTAEWLARFRDGRSICGKPTTMPAGGLGIVVCDRKWASHKQWFDLVGFGDIPHYSLCDDGGFNPEVLHNRVLLDGVFEKAIKSLGLGRGALVVVDPISIFISGNLIDYRQTAVSLIKLERICSRLGVTVLGTAHMSKQKGKEDRYLRPQDRILGSTAFAGYTDTQMYLLSPDDLDTEYYGFGWIPHNAPSETFMFTRDSQGLFVPYEMPDKVQDQLHIYAMISEDPVGTRTKEILKACQDQINISKATFYRYLTEMKEAGKIEKIGHGSWRRVILAKPVPTPGSEPPPTIP